MNTWSRLSRELIWPAAAGNVLWATLSSLAEWLRNDDFDGHDDLMTLTILMVYLVSNFEYDKGSPLRGRPAAILLDYVHIVGISFFSILVHTGNRFAGYVLAVVYLTLIVMHACGFSANSHRSSEDRIAFGFLGFSGLFLVAMGLLVDAPWGRYIQPLSLAVTYGLWLSLRRSQAMQRYA